MFANCPGVGRCDPFIQECRRLTLSGTPASILVACEVVILCLGGFVLFRRWGCSVSESCAYALVTPLMLLSALFQLSFIAGIPLIAAALEILLTVLAATVCYRQRTILTESLAAGRIFFSAHPVISGLTAALGLYLLLTGFVLPPEPDHWPSLAVVLHLQKSGGVPAWFTSATTSLAADALPPLNIVILPHLFLRFHTDVGLGLFVVSRGP